MFIGNLLLKLSVADNVIGIGIAILIVILIRICQKLKSEECIYLLTVFLYFLSFLYHLLVIHSR